jgi:predicted ATPase
VTTTGRRLVGRDAEIRLLRQHLDDVGTGPVVVRLIGEPGSGKTALVADVEAHAVVLGP